jgi:outer membrane protein OmpA-like peptidoglycan-associated protein
VIPRRRALVATFVWASLWVAGPSNASAQRAGITLDRYYPAETGEDGFAVSRPLDLGRGRFAARLDLEYANDALVWETELGETDSETEALVAHQFVAHLGVAVGIFDRVVFFAGMPITLVMDGDPAVDPGARSADGTGAGDPWLGMRLRIFGDDGDLFSAGVSGAFRFPLAHAADEQQAYLGESSLVGEAELVLEVRPWQPPGTRRRDGLRIAANLGTRFRERVRFGPFFADDALTFALGVTMPIYREGPTLEATFETYGETSFASFGDREVSPIEALLGLKLGLAHGTTVTLAAGTGLQRGFGTPDLRVVAGVGYTMPDVRIGDRPERVAPGDGDLDGVTDDVDRCANDREDLDGFEDADGCPDFDNDADQVADVRDGAPNDPEDHDWFEDEDGVPEPDNDRDRLADGSDGCPTEAEDPDGLEDEDGCPELDADDDNIRDPDDRCPLTAGIIADDPECVGCPALACVHEETGEIEILERVEFASNRDRILEESRPVLGDIVRILETTPRIRRIRIEGHTDGRGADASNMDLSKRRAASVRQWLLERGIGVERVEAWGCGEIHPRDANESRSGQQTNRRVEFHILDPAPSAGARFIAGCEAADEAAPHDVANGAHR